MPELPEVETIRRTLEQRIAGKMITDVRVNYPGIIKYPLADVDSFRRGVCSARITHLSRRGKYLIICLDNEFDLIVHLRMTGRLLFGQGDCREDKHTHVVFTLENDEYLLFHDVRKFGMIYLQNKKEDIKSSGLKNIGVEPLGNEFTLKRLKEIIKNKRRKAKAFLLDQSIIAGIGNIYADEILFQAQINPEEYVNNLNEEQIAALHYAIRDRLQEGIKNNGTTIRDYVDAEGTSGGFQNLLSVYGKYNEECPICNAKLQKLVIAGRSTCFCPHCQQLSVTETKGK